jgi:hypothetical protein
MSHYTHYNLTPVTQVTVQQTMRTVSFLAGMYIHTYIHIPYYYSGKFSWGLIFVVFADKWLSAKIGPHENFPLYGNIGVGGFGEIFFNFYLPSQCLLEPYKKAEPANNNNSWSSL